MPRGRHAIRSMSPMSPMGRARSNTGPNGSRARSLPTPRGRPRTTGSTSPTVAGLRTISPAWASDSISAVVVALGPVMTISRCRPPARKTSYPPLWMPTDIRSVTRPAEVCSRLPTSRSLRRIRWAERHARRACSTPVYRIRTASPPHFTTPPPSS